jgi:hypothetical protein
MSSKQETLRLLRDETCVNCKFSWKSGGKLLIFQNDIAFPLRMPRICDYDNIVIWRPKGMEFPMTKEVEDIHHCDKYKKRNYTTS